MELFEPISIVIPTMFSRLEYLTDLLYSLTMQQEIKSKVEVVFVDNNENPKEEVYSKIFNVETKLGVRIIHEPQNGLHNARHAGSRMARGDLLIFIDDDVRVPKNWLQAYQNFFKNPEIICAGGRVLPEWEVQPENWIIHIPKDVFSLLDYGDEIRQLNAKEGINGCNFAIRKSAVFSFGGFHPDGYASPDMKWFRGDGEYGLIQNLKMNGKEVYYLPSAELYHRIPKQRMQLASIENNIVGQSISRAYGYCREHHCSKLSSLKLFWAGLLLGSFHFTRWLLSTDKNKKILYTLKSRKYFVFSCYILRLISNKSLQEYVLKENYL